MESETIVLNRIQEAQSIVVLTGAGISKNSGISTLRGKGGLWEHHMPKDVPSQNEFLLKPEDIWQKYNYFKKSIKAAKPTKTHYMLAHLEEHFRDRFHIITQNIDSLHTTAGSKNIYELHGNVFYVRCVNCKRVYKDNSNFNNVPVCKYCGGLLRPNVVWFGENLPISTLNKAMELSASCDIFLILGTSGVVQPAASLPKIAHNSGAYVAEFNIDYTLVSMYADQVFLGECDSVFVDLFKMLI